MGQLAARMGDSTSHGTPLGPGAPALWEIGMLSGGYGREELERAGPCRVYEDPADLLKNIDEVGGRG